LKELLKGDGNTEITTTTTKSQETTSSPETTTNTNIALTGADSIKDSPPTGVIIVGGSFVDNRCRCNYHMEKVSNSFNPFMPRNRKSKSESDFIPACAPRLPALTSLGIFQFRSIAVSLSDIECRTCYHIVHARHLALNIYINC